jgi:hypothetical protein
MGEILQSLDSSYIAALCAGNLEQIGPKPKLNGRGSTFVETVLHMERKA